MSDPLAEIVSLLRPRAGHGKIARGFGAWQVSRELTGEPFYCVVLEGWARLTVGSLPPMEIEAGDFVLVPALFDFQVEGLPDKGSIAGAGAGADAAVPGEVCHGDLEAPANARLLVGHFHFGSPDARLLVSLLPSLLHVRGAARLSTLVGLLTDEIRAARPARDMVLARLLDVVLLEALRVAPSENAPTGILRGLADERLAASLRRLHAEPARDWTIESLAQEAALSRSAFFKRFRAAIGLPPMEYLLAWRMALAKDHLRGQLLGMQEIAERIGYGSASAFSTAFTRFVGMPPSRYGVGQQKEQAVPIAV